MRLCAVGPAAAATARRRVPGAGPGRGGPASATRRCSLDPRRPPARAAQGAPKQARRLLCARPDRPAGGASATIRDAAPVASRTARCARRPRARRSALHAACCRPRGPAPRVPRVTALLDVDKDHGDDEALRR